MRKKKAIRLNNLCKFDDLIKKSKIAGTKFQADANLEIKAKGVIIENKRLASETKKKDVKSLEIALATAVKEKNKAQKELLDAYNYGVDKANEIYRFNVAKLTGLSLHLSKDGTKVPKPEKIKGCKVVQSEHSGKVKMRFARAKNVRQYMVMESTSTDKLDDNNFYPANPTSFGNSKGGTVTPKQLGVPTWWRVYGHNASGDGVWSDPFGGFPVY